MWTEPLGTPLVSKQGNLWKSELHLVWVQGQCILFADFQKVYQMFVMFQVIPSAMPVQEEEGTSGKWYIFNLALQEILVMAPKLQEEEGISIISMSLYLDS